MLLAIKRDDGWQLGMARLTISSAQWFTVIGLSLRPRSVWRRGDFDLGPPTTVEGICPVAVVVPVQVDCFVAGEQVRIALAEGDYTALRSWSESAPPGLNANVA